MQRDRLERRRVALFRLHDARAKLLRRRLDACEEPLACMLASTGRWILPGPNTELDVTRHDHLGAIRASITPQVIDRFASRKNARRRVSR